MIKQKIRNYNSCKTLNRLQTHNKKLTFLTQTLRFVKPAIEDIKNGNFITMKEFGAWLDELSAKYE